MTAQVDKWARLKIARDVIEAGGDLQAFCTRANIKKSAACNWLGDHAPDLRDKLSANAVYGMSRHQALVKLLLIRVASEVWGGQTRLSKSLGTTRNALHEHAKRWAPDGIEAAIADLWPGDDPPQFLPVAGRRIPRGAMVRFGEPA